MSYPVQIYKVALTNLTILKLPGIFWQHYWYIHFQNHFASSCKVFFFKIISLQARWKHMGTIGIWPNQRLLKSWLLKYVLVSRYRTRTIITRGLYFFTPLFTAVYIVERLLLQTAYVLNNDNSSFFESKIRGL